MSQIEKDPFREAATAQLRPVVFTTKDVAALLQISESAVRDLRRLGKPPPWEEWGPKTVRYPVNAFYAWIDSMASRHEAKARADEQRPMPTPSHAPITRRRHKDDGLDEPIFRGGRRKAIHSSFALFLSDGRPTDDWLFVLRGLRQRPIDWIATLTDERDDQAEVVWLTLGEYLARLRHAAEAELGDAHRDALEKIMKSGQSVTPPRP